MRLVSLLLLQNHDMKKTLICPGKWVVELSLLMHRTGKHVCPQVWQHEMSKLQCVKLEMKDSPKLCLTDLMPFDVRLLCQISSRRKRLRWILYLIVSNSVKSSFWLLIFPLPCPLINKLPPNYCIHFLGCTPILKCISKTLCNM